MIDILYGPKIAIEETEKYFLKQNESVAAFKSHQSRLLTTLSLIVSISGLLIGMYEGEKTISQIIFWMVAIMFFIEVIIIIVLIRPVGLDAPFKIDYDNFEKLFFDKSEQKVLENKLENYTIVINNNRKILARLVWLSWISTSYFLDYATLFL